MAKIDSLLNQAHLIYYEPIRNDRWLRMQKLSQLELQIQELLQKDHVKPKPLMMHRNAKKPISPE